MRRYIYVCLCFVLLSCDTTGQPAPLATATPEPSPLSPAELLHEAQEQQEQGQYEQAAGEYQQVITQYPESPEARVAEFGLAHSAFMRRDWSASRSLLEAFINQGGDDVWMQRALFLMARVNEELGDHQGALEAYLRYSNLQGPLTGYAHIRRAALLRSLDRPAEAAAAYVQGASEPIAPSQRVFGYESALELHAQAGDQSAVLEALIGILGFARSPAYRPQILAQAADQALLVGRDGEARVWLREIVDTWPGAGVAPSAVDQLRALGEGVAADQAGTIFYTHGRWTAAISEFEAALNTDLSPEERAEARRKRALAIRELGDYATAQQALFALADEQPDTPIGRQARLDAIQTHGQQGDRAGAMEYYRQFASAYPTDPLAPEALRRVVEIVSWGADPAALNNARLELGQRFPWSIQGQAALHDAGLYAFRTGNYEQALAAWTTLGEHNVGLPQAQGYYWAGRTAVNSGDQERGAELIRRAYAAYPDSYYGARAADLLGIVESANLPLSGGISAEHATEARTWIAQWASVPVSDTSAIDVAPLQQRAYELGLAGMPEEARGEWLAARDAASDNPLALYDIALAAARNGAAYPTVLTARSLLEHAPAEAVELPVAIRQLLYPAPYATAVINHSQAFEVDPRLVYALMRQESIFNPDATSWVGARGLAQVMPATGEGIAQNLGIEPFHPDDLYHPVTSIRFGAFYISAQLKRMNGSVHAALAAYNGGPGNAERWAGGNEVPDPDRFLATIDYPETEHYVEIVYANYGAYRRLYRQTE